MNGAVNLAALRGTPETATGTARALLAFGGTWASTVFFLWPGKDSLPGAAVSAASFFLAPLVFPRSRFRVRPLVTPVNWMLFAFSLQLLITPATVRLWGIHSGVMPGRPSEIATNVALLLDAAGFWAFCAALQIFRKERPAPPQARSAPPDWIPGVKLPLVFICLGLIGMALSFGSMAMLVLYVTDPVAFYMFSSQVAAEGTTLASLAATFLKPFLGFGCVLLWCRSIDLPMRAGERSRWLSRAGLVAVIGLSYAFMNYNRGSFAVALVAILGVIGKRLPGAALRYWIAAGAVFVVLVGGVTLYKRTESHLVSAIVSEIDLVDEFQMYGHAPYYDGYFLERSRFGLAPSFGRIVISSILYPVPVLGKPFRSSSGTVLYNDVLQRGDPPDQIVPFTGELFLDFHLPGVLLGLGVVGWAIAKLQSRFDKASSAAEVYILLFAAIWLGFLPVGSIDVVSQIAVYSSPPIYFYLWRRKAKVRKFSILNYELSDQTIGPEKKG